MYWHCFKFAKSISGFLLFTFFVKSKTCAKAFSQRWLLIPNLACITPCSCFHWQLIALSLSLTSCAWVRGRSNFILFFPPTSPWYKSSHEIKKVHFIIKHFLIENKCKTPIGCLTFIFYQNIVECKMDLRLLYFHVTKYTFQTGFELSLRSSQIAKWILIIAIEQFQMLQKCEAVFFPWMKTKTSKSRKLLRINNQTRQT